VNPCLPPAIDAGGFKQDILVSPLLAPAFMRKAPPIVPGMPKKNSSPLMLAAAAVSATRLSSAAAPGANDVAFGVGLAEPTRTEPDHHARHAAIAHDQVGADPDDIDRKLARQMREKISEIAFI